MATSPNPYDQFDAAPAAAANPYDQFDAMPQISTPTQPTQYQTTTPYDSALGATHPVTAEIAQGLGNARIGIGAMYTDVGQRLHQLYNFIRGGPSMDAEIQEKRAMDQQINSTYGGSIGRAAAVAPGAVLTGPAVGANALYGGILGALQPTTSTDLGGNLGSTALNTGVGAAIAGGTAAIGNGIANWATGRASQPLRGWTPASADTTLARAVGSDAPNLGGGALGARGDQLAATFEAGRNAATSVDLSSTPGALDQIGSTLNPSVRALIESNQNIMDLTSHATGAGAVNGQMLGRISTGLRQDASQALNSEGGNREVGLALQRVRNHVEDLIESHIADPGLRASYAAARPQYGLLQDVRYNPTVLNASTGRANMDALGRYLQRNNPAYTAEGASDTPLFNAAMWGQAGGGAKGAPSFSLGTPWKLPLYALTHNAPARALGGASSRVIAPVATQVRYGLSGLGIGAVPVALPYLEQ